MFPIVHHRINKALYPDTSPLIILGALYPDMASTSGYNRNEAHTMGDTFAAWCKINAPWGIDLAKGIISHGCNPYGVDYYSDEFWPGGEKGWCFQQGVPWMPEVARTTNLPENLIWWKAHNFVEMSLELIMIDQDNDLNSDILKAVDDHGAVKEVAQLLAAYAGLDESKIEYAYNMVPEVFALEEVSPQYLATRQGRAYRLRHQVYDYDEEQMAELLRLMSISLLETALPFSEQLEKLVSETLTKY